MDTIEPYISKYGLSTVTGPWNQLSGSHRILKKYSRTALKTSGYLTRTSVVSAMYILVRETAKRMNR